LEIFYIFLVIESQALPAGKFGRYLPDVTHPKRHLRYFPTLKILLRSSTPPTLKGCCFECREKGKLEIKPGVKVSAFSAATTKRSSLTQ
jgi:hypothetical protein